MTDHSDGVQGSIRVESRVIPYLFLTSRLLLLLFLLPTLAAETSADESSVTDHLLPLTGWQVDIKGDTSRQSDLPFVLSSGTAQELIATVRFDLPPDSNSNVVYLLRFDGVNYDCGITINGHFVHSHALGYAPFQLELPPDVLKPDAENILQLEIDNHLDYKRTLPVLGGIRQSRNETGLPRSLELTRKPEVHISSVQLHPRKSGNSEWQLQVEVSLRHAGTATGHSIEEEYTLSVNLPDQLPPVRQKVFLHPQSTETILLELRLNDPALWSVSEPRLFPVEVALTRNSELLDTQVVQYGLRELELTADQLQLNGSPFQLKGLIYHLDGVRGQLLSDEQLLEDVTLIKNLGCNAVVLRGAPAPAELLEICDREGLFVVDNLPVEHPLPGLLKRDSFRKAALAYLEALVNRDRNHPSLLAINLLTDAVMGTAATDRFLAELLASLPEQSPPISAHYTAIAGTPELLPSLLMVNEQQLSELPRQLPGQGPLLVSGIGLLAEAGNLAGYANPWSEIHQAQQLDLLLQQYNSEQYAGIIINSFADWHGAHPLLWQTHPLDLSLHTDGLYTLDRQEKIAARVVHSHLTGTALPPLNRGDFSHSAPIWPSLIPLALLLLLVIAMRYNNILTLNLKRSLVHTEGFYRDIQSRRSQQLGQGAFVALINSLMLASLIAVTFYYFRKELFFDEILTLLFPIAGVKTLFIYLSWHPLSMQVYTGLMLFLLQWITGILFFLIGVLFGSATSLRQMLQYLFWSSTPLLFLLPLALVFGQLLTFPGGTAIIGILLTLFTLWFLVRLVRVSRFAYPANLGKVIGVIFILSLLIMLILFFYYESGMAFTDRLLYLINIY